MLHEDGMSCRHCMFIHVTKLYERLLPITADCQVAPDIDNLCFVNALHSGSVAWHSRAVQS